MVLPAVPWVSDNWGRRWAIVLGSVIMLIGAAIQAAAQNCSLPPLVPLPEAHINDLLRSVAMFVIGRFVLGCGIPFAIVAASSLIGGESNNDGSGAHVIDNSSF